MSRALSVVAAVAMLTLAGCQGGGDETPSSSASAPAQTEEGYVEAPAPGLAACTQDGDTTLDLGGRGLEALAFGAGEVGVLLAHQAGQGPCSWDAEGRELAAAGYLVLMPSLGTNDPVGDMQLGVDWLLASGADRVAFVGASMGGTVVLAAAAATDPAPATVVALSAPTTYGRTDALGTAAELSMPVLLAAASDDAPFATDAATLAAAIGDAEQVVVPGRAHGIELLEDPQVHDALLAALAAA